VRPTLTTICRALGGDASLCNAVVEEVEDAGIDCLLDQGGIELWGAGIHVIGKGWAGIVLAARRGGQLAALKILNPSGRRRSLLAEGIAAYAASLLGAAKPVLHVGRYSLVYEMADGPTLGEYRPGSPREALDVVLRLTAKTYLLDRAGLRHNELARPEGHVVIDYAYSRPEPYIIDYESATWRSRGATNLSQLLGGLPRTSLGRYCGLEDVSRDSRLRQLLHRYKHAASDEERRAALAEVAGLLAARCTDRP